MADETTTQIEEQFAALPQVVQNAILSGHVQEKFQELAKKHQLHYDEWSVIENEIMLTVLGLRSPDDLVNRVVSATNLGREKSVALVEDASDTVFRPIREELERELGHPQARAEKLPDVEKVREAVLSQSPETKPPPVQSVATVPATPPSTPPVDKVTRAPASGAYKPGEASSARADVHDDPYREPPK